MRSRATSCLLCAGAPGVPCRPGFSQGITALEFCKLLFQVHCRKDYSCGIQVSLVTRRPPVIKV